MTALDGLRALLSVSCTCEEDGGPRPIGEGRVYHFQGCPYDLIRDYLDDAEIAELTRDVIAHPPEGTRLVLVSETFFDEFVARTERGERTTVEWGEQRPEGWYEPTVTVHSDDRIGCRSCRTEDWRGDYPRGGAHV